MRVFIIIIYGETRLIEAQVPVCSYPLNIQVLANLQLTALCHSRFVLL